MGNVSRYAGQMGQRKFTFPGVVPMTDPTRRNWPAQTTWLMRAMGPAFNPDRVCEYTGLALYPFPMPPDLMGVFRADGTLRACCPMTPEERAWIAANPVAYQAERAEFEAWRERLPRKDV